MISSVCQGLQSQVESHVLSFQLFPQNPSHSLHKEGEEVEENSIRNRGEDCNGESGENGQCWSFLEGVSKGNGNEDEKLYVHDVVKRSSTSLSKKSLEMCTESLGSESGSDMGENDMCLLSLEVDDSPSPPPSIRSCSTWGVGIKKANRRRDTAHTTTFPPPLTSMSGSNGVRVESYREDGRLVLRAVATSASRTTYFHAERTQGRLRLQLLKHMEQDDDDDDDRVFGAEVEEEEAYWPETKEESHGEEMGMENYTRPCSCSCRCNCKQGRRHTEELLNWEPLWVST